MYDEDGNLVQHLWGDFSAYASGGTYYAYDGEGHLIKQLHFSTPWEMLPDSPEEAGIQIAPEFQFSTSWEIDSVEEAMPDVAVRATETQKNFYWTYIQKWF